MSPLMLLLCFLLLLSYTFHFSSSSTTPSAPLNSLLPSDAVSLLSFKSKADLDNKLLYTLNERFDYCQWQGVKCVQGRVVRFVLQGFSLRGTFPTNSLTNLDQLRILNLRNNSLSGTIPDLSGLPNLKTLFLDHNFFSGTFPISLLSLHRLVILDLSRNNLTGSLPVELTVLDRLSYLKLDSNLFNGSIPALNQTQLKIFNVSNNNLTGPVPVTPTLKKFNERSFLFNPSLCGEVVNKPCRAAPFFDSPSGVASPPTPLYQDAQSQGILLAPPTQHKHKKVGVILGSMVGTLIVIAGVLSLFAFVKKRREETEPKPTKCAIETITNSAVNTTASGAADNSIQEVKLEKEVKLPQGPQRLKSGNLIFCSGETELYTLEQLMRGSAELLGRGTIGTTYKALMASQLVVTVKRLDACKTSITCSEAFEQHMESVGMLRHPNLVAVRAYFQAKQERLVIYDYQPNGSLFNLIHGSRSTRARPLHWTSCLKIAEDVAQGLAYIHQASKLTHGNLKSSNVLLGSDFEACLTDYSLIVLADISSDDDPDSARYKAPEVRKSARRVTPGSDVYAYGILLLELLTGKPPSQHPHLSPPDVPDWVRAMREDDNEEDRWLAMLVDLASICSLTSPEQRPTMRQILKMIQDIKDNEMVENNKRDAHTGYS
ncbi:probable inactive receptor kinase At5g67200 [Lycium barbarum]|uniref:probable inactive receptor kinase At5g67200 n=1 Tax=Lycium barbarum TaxID=112863 RepID=UPI00293F6B3C|nr:probable inactive receptor kinase At5g67200 [Lycium barbarum]